VLQEVVRYKMYIIYGKTSCPYCVSAKELLSGKSLPFEYIDLTDKTPEFIDNLKQMTGMRSVPIIYYNNVLIGGYTDLKAKL
jgi:glutaredoxin 3